MIEILLAVFVGTFLYIEEKFVVVVLVGAEELVFLRDAAVDLDTQDSGCLEGPAS